MPNEIAGVYRRSKGGGKDKIGLLPSPACWQTFTKLARTVPSRGLHGHEREGNDPSAPVGLRFHKLKLTLQILEGKPNSERPGVQINILPTEPKGLPLPRSDGEAMTEGDRDITTDHDDLARDRSIVGDPAAVAE